MLYPKPCYNEPCYKEVEVFFVSFYFSEEIWLGISCELSDGQTIHMKCQALLFFFLKKKKKKKKILSEEVISFLRLKYF